MQNNVTKNAAENKAAERIHATVSAEHYAGLSSYLNSERKTAIGLSVKKYGKRDASKFTPRMHGCIAAMRAAYGTKSFRARGFDNAQIAIFINSGVLTYNGGATDDTGYLRDAESPVMLKLTPAFAKNPAKA